MDISCCFFRLSHAIYRHVQESGLEVQYNNPADRTIKNYTHTLLALAFVPITDVRTTFQRLKGTMQKADFKPVLQYFDKTYVNGTQRRGGRGNPPYLWNQYQIALTKVHLTNNVSEGWHERFQIVIGRLHPDLFTALRELQLEQADTETIVAELSAGRKVKALPRHQWVLTQDRIQGLTAKYEEYKDTSRNEVSEYLRLMSEVFTSKCKFRNKNILKDSSAIISVGMSAKSAKLVSEKQ